MLHMQAVSAGPAEQSQCFWLLMWLPQNPAQHSSLLQVQDPCMMQGCMSAGCQNLSRAEVRGL